MIISLIFAVSAIVVSLMYGLPFLLRKTEQSSLQKYCSANGILALTYDDGPGPRLTRNLLEIFDSEGVRVTFFFLGMRAEKHPDIVNQAKDAGHEIGFHGQNHINYWKVSPSRASHDLRKGYQALSHAMEGKGIFRPPYGKLTLLTLLELKRQKIKTGWWTYVSGDTSSPLRPVDDVVSELSKNNGGVVLLHDFDRASQNIKYETYVTELTKNLIVLAKKHKWEINTIGAIIKERDKTLRC